MPKSRSLTSVILLAIVLTGCGANVSPVVNAQTESLQVLQRLSEFQDVVVDGYSTGAITPAHALLYSKWVVSATQVAKTLPTGWQSTLKTSWQQLEVLVPPSTMEPKVQTIAKLIDALMAVL